MELTGTKDYLKSLECFFLTGVGGLCLLWYVDLVQFSESLNPQVPRLQIGSPFWKLIVNSKYWCLSFKHVGQDFFFTFICLVTFLEASKMTYFNSYRYWSSHFRIFGVKNSFLISYTTLNELLGRALASGQSVAIHPSSVLFGKKPDCVVFNELVRTNRSYIRNVTQVDSLWLPELAPHYYATQGLDSSSSQLRN